MTANEALNQYMSGLTNRERIAKSRDIREMCGISTCVLSFWRIGRTPIKKIYQDKISEIIGRDIFAGTETFEK